MWQLNWRAWAVASTIAFTVAIYLETPVPIPLGILFLLFTIEGANT